MIFNEQSKACREQCEWLSMAELSAVCNWIKRTEIDETSEEFQSLGQDAKQQSINETV